MTEKQRQYFAKIPQVYQKNFQTAMSGKSRAAAIKAKCLDCTNWQRVEVADCLVETCPLWPYRPYRSTENLKNPQKPRTLEKKTPRG